MKRYITYIVFLAITEIALAFYLTEWRATFWNYVQERNFHGFLIQIGIFTGVALLFCAVTAFSGYFTALTAIHWREVLTKRANITKDTSSIENFSQRVQEDCSVYPTMMLNVIFGFGKAVVYILVFSASLVYNFNLVYLIIVLSYAVLSTILARKISKPLINLNYRSQVAEATYRGDITISNFQKCISIMTGLAVKTKHLNYFQSFYGQLAVVLPIIIVAPAYFSGALSLGALMMATSTMATVSDNCSYGIYNFDVINKLLSCSKRLKEIKVI